MRSSYLQIPLVERKLLTQNSSRKAFHLSFDISNTELEYDVGDILGVYPCNAVNLVDSFINAFGLQGDKVVYFSREDCFLTFREYLICFANLDRVPSICKSWLEKEYNQDFSFYRFHELFTFFTNNQLSFSEQQFVDALAVLVPRFYSIASYCFPEEKLRRIDLLVSLVVIKEHPRVFGTCSYYLCSEMSLNQLARVFIKKSRNFSLPSHSEDKPILMISTGSGLAPFRGFLQKRRKTSPSCGNYLFFGDQHSSVNFYYKDFFEELIKKDILRLFCAFSRDQEEKIYVQHLLVQQKDLVLSVIDEEGYIFVCGSKVLGKAIDNTLLQILKENYDSEQAKQILQNLRNQNRYLKDVY